MAHTESTMLGLGTTAPDFALTDVVTGKTVQPRRLQRLQSAPRPIHLRPLSLRQAH